MAKNWYDGPVPTADLGILGGLPSLALTEEDKKRAFWQAMMQGGMGMAAASLGGANTAQSLGKGLLGGADAYGQGLMAPQSRFDAYAKQLKVQGDQIGNAKGLEELGKLKREASDYSKQNDFFSMLNDPGQAAMLYGGGPTLQNEQRATQFGANPAAMLSDPRINLKALQARVDPKQLGAALENTRPFKLDAGAMYQNANGSREQIPMAQPGMTVQRQPDGSYVAVPIKGFNSIIGDQELNKSMAQKNAQLEYDRITRGNTVVNQPMQGGRTEPVTADAALNYARGNNANALRIPADVQARRDAIAQGVYDAEGAGTFSPRLNDSPGGGVRPQMTGLDRPGGQSPGDRTQTEELGKGLAKYYEDIRGKANDTNSMLAKYKQINQLLGDFEGGKLSPTMTDIASAANSVGLKIDPKLANKEAARNIVATMMGDFKSMLPGSMSDADRKFLSSIPPSESTSATGRAKILMVQEKLA